MRTAFVGLAIAGIFVGANLVRAADEKVDISKLPKPVTDALKKKWPDAQLLTAEKETENGKTVYDVGMKVKDKSIEATVTPEGKIESYEIEIPVANLPKAAKAAVDAKYPNATYNKVEEVYKVGDGKDKMEQYEISLTKADKKKASVLVTAEGKITSPDEKPAEKNK